MALETTDIVGVPILAAGGPYFGRGSPPGGDYFTERMLQRIAANAAALKGELHAPIKLGHTRAQRLLRNSGLYSDEMPAAGWVENLRVAGGKLLADLVKVPKKLAALISSEAFPSRSVELNTVTSQRNGEVFDPVVTALALLGSKAPAVRTLDDIVALYSARAYSQDEPLRQVVDVNGRVLTLPQRTAELMERALATVPGRISEEQYREYAARCGIPYRPKELLDESSP
jgi:hypothetical protein